MQGNQQSIIVEVPSGQFSTLRSLGVELRDYRKQLVPEVTKCSKTDVPTDIFGDECGTLSPNSCFFIVRFPKRHVQTLQDGRRIAYKEHRRFERLVDKGKILGWCLATNRVVDQSHLTKARWFDGCQLASYSEKPDPATVQACYELTMRVLRAGPPA